MEATYRFRYTTAAILFLILFYAVGMAGIIHPYSQNLFLKLTQFALILNFLILMLFHEQSFTLRSVFVFVSVFALSYLIEVVGVNTGAIFGHYQYGEGLGLKLFQTPLLIGINWLLLSYSFFVVANKIRINSWIAMLIAATGMLLFDLLLEQLAAYLDMWHWVNNTIPLQNYVAWFVVALVMQMILNASRETFKNKLALPTLLVQLVFFLFLLIAKNMVQ